MNPQYSPSRRRGAALVAAAVLLTALVAGALAPMQAQDVIERKDPPSATAQGEAEALIKKLFADRYKSAVSNKDEARGLALELLSQGRMEKDDLTLAFVALMQASELATRAGDNDTALEAIAELSKHYKVDTADMKSSIFAMAEKGITDKDQARALAETVLAMVEEPLEMDNFAAADKLIDIAQKAAFKSQVIALVAKVKKAEMEVKEAKEAFKDIKPFVDALKTEKDEDKLAEPRLKVGKYYTFTKGDFERGLPLLAKSKDAGLKALADKDIFKPKDPKEQVKLADEWNTRGEAAKGLEQRWSLQRALTWYQEALPKLEGLTRFRVDKRVEELVKSLPPPKSGGGSFSFGGDSEITTELKKFEGHNGGVQSIAISNDGSLILSGGGGDNTVRLWDVKTGQKKKDFFGHTGSIQSVAISSDKKFGLSGSTDNTMRLWNLESGQEVRRFLGHNDWVRVVYFAPDKKHVVSACDDKNVRIFDMTSGNLVKTIGGGGGHTNYINGMGLSRDGKKALTCSVDFTVRAWNLDTGAELKKFGHTKTVQHCDLSPDGRKGVTTSYDNTVKVWDVEKGTEERQLPHPGMVWYVKISPSGKRVYTAGGGGPVQADGTVQFNMSNNQIRVFDLTSGKEIRQIGQVNGHTNYVRCLDVTPDGRFLVSGSSDNSIRLWGPK